MTSEARLDELLAHSFHAAPARDANAEIARVRRERGTEHAEALSYEVLLSADAPARYLVESVLPKLVYFLDCRGLKLPNAPGVFLSLFVGEHIHFLPMDATLELLSRWSGLDYAEMVRRWGAASV